MALVRRLVELGRAARAESGVKTRQPLSRALASARRLRRRSPPSCAPRSPTSSTSARWRRSARPAVRWSTPRRRPTSGALGKRFGKGVQPVAPAIAAADAAALAGGAARTARRRSTSTARRSTLAPGRGDHHRDARARAGRSPPTPARPSRWTCSHAGAAPGRPGPGRDPADPGGPQDQPASTSPTGSRCATGAADDETAAALARARRPGRRRGAGDRLRRRRGRRPTARRSPTRRWA